MPYDLPPWHTVNQQTRRWVRAGYFETMAEDLPMATPFAGYHCLAFALLMLKSLFAKSA